MYHPEAFDDYDGGLDAGVQDGGAPDAGFDADMPDADMPDAGTPDAGHDAGADAGPICNSRQPPMRVSGSGGDGAEIVFVLRNVVFAQPGTLWNDIGFDLDETCSDTPSTTTCGPRAGSSPQLDGADGVDNVAGREILRALTVSNPGLQVEARRKQDTGDSTFIVRITGWDGSDDDALVTISVSQSIYAVPMGGVRGDTLRWDGTDSFFATEGDFVDGDPTMPLIVDDAAYITGRSVVMRLPEGRSIFLPWLANPLSLRLTDATVVGDISADGETITNVRLAGRWALLDISAALTEIGVCPGGSDRLTIDAIVERVADVRSDPGTDSLMLDCDAVSFSVGFDGTRAIFGGTVPPPPSLDLCTP